MQENTNEMILEVKDLEVVYETKEETVHAVNHIDFSLNKGETLGMVGETGAGKTTTMLALMRLLPERTGRIRSGKIVFEGENLLDLSENDMRTRIRGERMAMIFQDPMTAMNPTLSIGEQIEEAIRYHNVDLSKEEIAARVEQVLELVNIPASRKNEYPHQFSGGMKQRVVIAMALSCEPSLLIADEPTTALDVTIQAQVLAMMADLRDRLGMSMIMITHDLGIVAQICDKVCVVYAGEIIEAGTLEDIFVNKDHHPYTVGLFGAIPNLKHDTRRLSPIDGLMPDPSKLPAGCKFNDRCPHCMEICKSEMPPVYHNGTHSIQCHLFADRIEKEDAKDE